jgi:CDP-diacylglycerol---serine O-phosphatidyltransferase
MSRNKKYKTESFRRGIYIVPNLFTTMNIFCGFYAVIAAVNGNFITAPIAILVAAMFDILDGKIARATKSTSRFGVEYDSLADLISFGMAPGIMIYLWALEPMGRIAWLAAFLFTVCGALRLARYNTQAGNISNNYFVGLPIPAAAVMAATTILFFNKLELIGGDYKIQILLLLYALSFLMVSTVRYNSFKHPELYWKIRFNVLVGAILVLMLIAAQPSIALFSMGLIYVISGPFNMLWNRKQTNSVETEKSEDVQREEKASPANS